MKILLIDDDYAKVEALSAVIVETGIGNVEITHESTAHAGRVKIQSTQFDLLIVDVNLPPVAGSAPEPDGGIRLFELITQDVQSNLPVDVLFVTALAELVDHSRLRVERLGGALCTFGLESSGWKNIVAGRIRYAAQKKAREMSISADVVIITALGYPEIDAVLNLPYHWTGFKLKGDPTSYHRGSFVANGNEIVVIAASALRKGMASSASLATKMALKFSPRIVGMTGICAGVADKTSLGDVVIGDPTWDWGSGKHGVDDEGLDIFRQAPVQKTLNTHLANLAAEISDCEIFKANLRKSWMGPVPKNIFKAHVGPMASGSSVVADNSTPALIASQNKDLIAIEMEAFAVMTACDSVSTHPPLSVAIKSVCDFANPSKSDDWQLYASYTSARFADELFRRYFSS